MNKIMLISKQPEYNVGASTIERPRWATTSKVTQKKSARIHNANRSHGFLTPRELNEAARG